MNAIAVRLFFLLIAVIAVPNLYYRSQYNVPLMLFAFASWNYSASHSNIVVLLLLSWIIDTYCILQEIRIHQLTSDRPRLILYLQIVVFVLKMALIGLLIYFDDNTRQLLHPGNVSKKLRAFFQDFWSSAPQQINS